MSETTTSASTSTTGGTPGSGTTGGVASGTSGSGPWYQGLAGVDAELIGHWQNKGWASKTAQEIAVEATRAHRQAEKFIGAPADQIIRLPQANDEAAWNQVWNRLGRPAEATGYDFSGIQFADGEALDDAFTGMFSAAAHRLNVPKDTASSLAREIVKYLDGVAEAEKTESDAALAVSRDGLRKNWGPNYDANMFVAKQAATALNVAPEAVTALESVIGYDKVMEMFRSIGQRIGEDRFVSSTGTGGSDGVMTKDQAVAKRADLMADADFRKRYLAGDPAAARQMTALNTLIVGSRDGRR